MPDAQLWRALAHQAQVWSTSPVVGAVAAQLPPNADQATSGVPGYLQSRQAGGLNVVGAPLVVATALKASSSMPSLSEGEPDAQELAAWRRAAERVEAAHRGTVAWFRSRLPGYPMIPAPQLARGTDITTFEWTNRLIWTPQERQMGLQFESTCPSVAGELGLSGGEQLSAAAEAVSAALADTEQWQVFAAAASDMTPEVRQDLQDARSDLAASLRPEHVDAHEPQFALPRGLFREQMTRRVVDNLPEPAGAFARAFDGVNNLVDLATSDVFGQLVMFGRPMTLDVADLDHEGDDPPYVNFEVPNLPGPWLDCGRLAELNSPLVTDAVRIEAMNHSMEGTDMRTRARARVIEGTGSSWTT